MITESSFHLIKPADFVMIMRWYDNHEMVVKSNEIYRTSGKSTITSVNASITTFTDASAASAATSPSTSFTSPSILTSPRSISVTSSAIPSVLSSSTPSISRDSFEGASEPSISGSSFGAIQEFDSYSARDGLISVPSWDDCCDIDDSNSSQDISCEGGNHIPTASDTITDHTGQKLQRGENETLHVRRHGEGTNSNERHQVEDGGLESVEIRFGCDALASSQYYTAEKSYMDSVAVDISGEWEAERDRPFNEDGNLVGGGPCPTIEPPVGDRDFYALEEFTGFETEDEEAEEVVHQMQLHGDQFWEDREEEEEEEEIEYWKVFGGQAGEIGNIDAGGYEVAGKWVWEKAGEGVEGVYTWGGRNWLEEWDAVFDC